MEPEGAGGLIGLDRLQQHSWQQHWLDDDDDQDSDTDSKLSGSAAADSVMRHLARAKLPYKAGGAEFGLDTMREQDEDEADGGQVMVTPPEDLSQHSYRGGAYSGSSTAARGVGHGGVAHGMTNGYHHHQLQHHHANPPHMTHHTPSMATPSTATTRSPQMSRRHPNASPQLQHRPRIAYENIQLSSSYQRKDMLGSLPEAATGGPRVLEISVPTALHGPTRGRGIAGNFGPGTQSMENMVTRGTPPSRRRKTLDPVPNGRALYKDIRIPVGPNGMASSFSSNPHSLSHEALPHMGMAGGVAGGMAGGMTYVPDPVHDDIRSDVSIGSFHQMQSSYRRTSSGSQAGHLNPMHSHSHSAAAGSITPNQYLNHNRSMSTGTGTRGAPVMVPSAISTSYSHSSDLGQSWPLTAFAAQGGGGVAMNSSKTPPQRRVNYIRQEIKGQNLLGFPLSSPGGSSSNVVEPNLDDVVQFLHSEDYIVVSNAASYLQHLAYNDDTMKNNIRDHGAIPILVNLIRHSENKVQITALGALKNLSFGRKMNENKQLIGNDHGLMEIMTALKKSRVSEVRELLTGLLWNLSSCEELKMRMIQCCLHDLVEIVMVPHTGWNTEIARELTARPQRVHWNNELKNTTGTLRNMSSAGESARSFMRSTSSMVDTLLWLLKAGVQQRSIADEKTVENTVCILRNLSYRLENEVDPQEGGEDVLDREWEQEQRRDAEDAPHTFSKRTHGCLALCVRPRTRDEVPRVPATSTSTTIYDVDFVYPDSSVMPKRRKPVYGKCLLWQPEVAFVYLAVVEQFPDAVETLESAAGAIQNLTACQWKWSVYIRNIIRTSNGLRLLADLLSNGHDTVVRAAALTLRNLVEDQRNRTAMGVQAVSNILPRLPLGSNHLGISEETSVALLCCLMELFNETPENASSFREKEGVVLLTRLARSREHTLKVTFAAHKTCAILWEYKDCKSALKKLGWDIAHYQHLANDEQIQLELEQQPRGSMARDFQGSRRKNRNNSKRSSKKSSKKKDRDREREEVGVVFIAGGLPRTSEVVECNPQTSTNLATMSSPVRACGSPDDNYQTIPFLPPARPSNHNSQQEQQQQQQQQQHQQQQQQTSPTSPESPIVPNYESVTASPGTGSSTAALSGPTIIYQSIDDSPLRKASLQSARMDTAMSSTASGPLSVTSEEPDPEAEPDPNATYAIVDIEKKRASRRAREQKKKDVKEEKERQKQQEETLNSEEPIDSWV